MKHIVQKITLFCLSAIVMVTLLSSQAQATTWYAKPTGDISNLQSNDGCLYGVFSCTAPITSPSESYYFKLTCVEDGTSNYYGSRILYLTIGLPYGHIAQTGRPIEIYSEDSEIPIEPSQFFIFPQDIVEIGKHYSVQLVSSTNGGQTYTAIGSPSNAVLVVDSSTAPETTSNLPYWYPCYAMIKELGKSNEPQTFVYEEGTSLPIEIMQALQECPNVTLIFRCSYDNTNYEFTISGDKAIVDSDIPWYGPLWLNQYYSN